MAENIPRHVGIIMDGNGRWAQRQGLLRTVGHRFGTETVQRAMEYMSSRGVEVLTLYAFSTENWKRPEKEISTIMSLLSEYLYRKTPEMKESGVRLCFIGDLSPIPEESMKAVRYAVDELKDGGGLKVNIALNYGGRAEIVNAVRSIARDVAEGKLREEDITEETVSERLYTAGDPDPDLIIRTGAETRLSNFLTWQSSYSELYFTPTLWPDMQDADFDKALEYYSSRDRRYGGLNDA
ncbi:MAG: isoprenyl transferase [Eubacteriaceae bacterium]|nr:isoprenyl transferase [Eubacteriaceae bacterium]